MTRHEATRRSAFEAMFWIKCKDKKHDGHKDIINKTARRRIYKINKMTRMTRLKGEGYKQHDNDSCMPCSKSNVRIQIHTSKWPFGPTRYKALDRSSSPCHS